MGVAEMDRLAGWMDEVAQHSGGRARLTGIAGAVKEPVRGVPGAGAQGVGRGACASPIVIDYYGPATQGLQLGHVEAKRRVDRRGAEVEHVAPEVFVEAEEALVAGISRRERRRVRGVRRELGRRSRLRERGGGVGRLRCLRHRRRVLLLPRLLVDRVTRALPSLPRWAVCVPQGTRTRAFPCPAFSFGAALFLSRKRSEVPKLTFRISEALLEVRRQFGRLTTLPSLPVRAPSAGTRFFVPQAAERPDDAGFFCERSSVSWREKLALRSEQTGFVEDGTRFARKKLRASGDGRRSLRRKPGFLAKEPGFSSQNSVSCSGNPVSSQKTRLLGERTQFLRKKPGFLAGRNWFLRKNSVSCYRERSSLGKTPVSWRKNAVPSEKTRFRAKKRSSLGKKRRFLSKGRGLPRKRGRWLGGPPRSVFPGGCHRGGRWPLRGSSLGNPEERRGSALARRVRKGAA